jgi:hypothetical protein
VAWHPRFVAITETKKKGYDKEVLGKYSHLWSAVDKESGAKRGISVII